MSDDTTATENVKSDATTDQTSTTTAGSEPVTTTTGSDGASSTSAGTSTATTTAPVQNERVLTDNDWYDNQAFKALGFMRPRYRTDNDKDWGFVPPNPDYIWISYQMKPYDTLVGKFWTDYGVRPYDIMKWSRIYNYDWQEKTVTVRLKRALLPHND